MHTKTSTRSAGIFIGEKNLNTCYSTCTKTGERSSSRILHSTSFKSLMKTTTLAKEDPEVNEIELHPEFGNWMVEAVPTHPYGTYEDLADMLTCFEKIR